MLGETVDIPLVIGGREVRTGQTQEIRPPHRLSHLLGTYHKGGAAEVEQAIAAAREAWKDWAATPWEERAAVFLRAAEMLAGPYRQVLNAATMLCQSKTVHQAEIDSACELIDFWRFNVAFAEKIYLEQPLSPLGSWNRMDYRPLEGFVFAVTPFNFTSIMGNLPTAPALMGCTVVWKPASTTVYTAWYLLKLLERAGLPPGVINLVAGPAGAIGEPALHSEHLAGIHFTGSTSTFHQMWRTVGEQIARYRNYPRIVGETGGKDFVVAHASADPEALVTALVRGAFENQGQKCSAASRAYIPASLWPDLKERLVEQVQSIRMGDVCDFRNFMGAVIDSSAFQKIAAYQQYARSSSTVKVLAGGQADSSQGYFVEPTVVETSDPLDRLMQEEIFGPFLTVYVYPDNQFDEVLELCDRTSPYGLTGSIFARQRAALQAACRKLRYTAGNFYINDKPTGAVVGQQPFGGSRASGTNDKAGSMWNLIRWVSPRAIKETFVPPTDYRYPFMAEE
jgi:1-pyrroline-5-carboxylate dehydrogenase